MLADLLPTTGYLLSYVLPLLLLSLPLTFAGAFFTLDRTRVFAPRKDAGYDIDLAHTPGHGLKPRRRFLLLLEGGLGGLAGGYLFGVHISTFLALLIPAVTSSASLGRTTFLVVWLLSSIPTTFLGARFRYAALAFLGVTGGASLALAIIIIIHPTLMVRVIFMSLITSIVALFVVLPLKATQHHALRLAACSTGAYGIILSAALLSHTSSWSSIYSRLWVSDGDGWGTPAEQGLSAGFCLLLAAGAACDWMLHRKFGTNPDERWDAYLADYAANLPNVGDRAGVFEPLVSPFAKLLHKHRDAPMVKPGDEEITAMKGKYEHDQPPPYAQGIRLQRPRKASLVKTPLSPGLETSAFTYDRRPGFLKKKSSRRAPASISSGRKREGVKFRPLEDFEGLTSSDEEDDKKVGLGSVGRPWLNRPESTGSFSAASGTTLVNAGSQSSKTKYKSRKSRDDASRIDVDKERAALAKHRSQAGGDKAAVDYSDYESDGSSNRRASARGTPGWSPEFIRRASQRSQGTIGSSGGLTTPGTGSTAPTTPGGPMRAVPATPSLIRAVDRLAAAQEAAYGSAGEGLGSGYGFPAMAFSGEVTVPHPVSGQEDKGERWMSFWRDVKEKAGTSADAHDPTKEDAQERRRS